MIPRSGVLTLTGDRATSATDFAAALQAVTYSDTSHAPNTTDRDISVVVTDSHGVSTNAANTIVRITAVNDAPVLTGVGPTHATSTERVAATLDGGAAVSDAELDALNSGNGDYPAPASRSCGTGAPILTMRSRSPPAAASP